MAPQLEELAVGAMTSDSVHLSWTAAQGPFDSFLVQYKDVQGQPQAVPVGGNLREVTVSGLAPARKYKFLLFGVQDGKRHGPLSADAKTRESRPKAIFTLEPLAILQTLVAIVGRSCSVLHTADLAASRPTSLWDPVKFSPALSLLLTPSFSLSSYPEGHPLLLWLLFFF